MFHIPISFGNNRYQRRDFRHLLHEAQVVGRQAMGGYKIQDQIDLNQHKKKKRYYSIMFKSECYLIFTKLNSEEQSAKNLSLIINPSRLKA